MAANAAGLATAPPLQRSVHSQRSAAPSNPRAVSTDLTSQDERLFPLLSIREEAFIVNYATNGGNGADAVREAGYSDKGAAVQAHRLLSKPAICAAIMQVCAMRQVASVPEAQAAVASLMRKSKSDYVRLEAAKDVLTRAGLAAPQRVAVSGGVSITIDLGD